MTTGGTYLVYAIFALGIVFVATIVFGGLVVICCWLVDTARAEWRMRRRRQRALANQPRHGA